MSDAEIPGLDEPRQTLRDMGLLVMQDGGEVIRKEDEYNVPRFLNRVLALDVERQCTLFDYFSELFDQTVRHAKASGVFDEGVTDVKALAVRLADSRVVHRDQTTGAETTHCTLEVDQPSKAVSFEQAEETRTRRKGAFFEHIRNHSYILAVESGTHTDPETGDSYRTLAVWKPEGAHISYIREQELNERYRPAAPEQARDWWAEKHAAIPAIQTSKLHVVGGAITPLWQRLKTARGTHLRVVRVTTDDGRRIVGALIASERVGDVLRALGVSRTLREPADIFSGVLLDGEEIELASGLTLKKGSIHGEPAIEICGAEPYRFKELRQLDGIINECLSYKQRFFVTTDEERGIAAIATLIARYPVLAGEESDDLTGVSPQASDRTEVSMIDLEEWIIEPAADMKIATVQPESATREATNKSDRETTSAISIVETGTRESINITNPQQERAADDYAKTAPIVPATIVDVGSPMLTVQLSFNFSSESSPRVGLDSGPLACAA